MIKNKTKIKVNLEEIRDIMREYTPVKTVFKLYDCVKLYGFPQDSIWCDTWKIDEYLPILRIVDYQTLKDLGFEPESCGLRIKLRKPGTGVPVHKDPYENKHGEARFEDKPAHRWVVQCSDWEIGQFCQVEDEVITHWKIGDAYRLTKNDAHLAVNFSNFDRLLITLTGFTK
jgi:hypothetical protein